jgi:hypothetical protein
MLNISLFHQCSSQMWTRFCRDGIINIHNQHQWLEENPHGVIHSRHQQQFSINVWAAIIGDW